MDEAEDLDGVFSSVWPTLPSLGQDAKNNALHLQPIKGHYHWMPRGQRGTITSALRLNSWIEPLQSALQFRFASGRLLPGMTEAQWYPYLP